MNGSPLNTCMMFEVIFIGVEEDLNLLEAHVVIQVGLVILHAKHGFTFNNHFL